MSSPTQINISGLRLNVGLVLQNCCASLLRSMNKVIPVSNGLTTLFKVELRQHLWYANTYPDSLNGNVTKPTYSVMCTHIEF